jgi:truncated hemoglobin YjbI
VKDTRINGFLLNRNVIPQRLIECLVLQLGAATGGPQMYPSAGCRDMKTTHRNLGISMVDFTDTAAHLVAALETYNVAPADRAAILSVLESMVPDIVEDPGNNRTVYQRIGRRPVIEQVVVAFMSDVFNDPRINGFFAGGDAARLQTCLVRMICSIDGPCKYGEEVDGFEAGVSRFAPCKDMVTAHQSIVAPRAITKADFDAVVQNLVGVLDRARVAPADKEAILRALGPTCRQIVPQGAGCN